MLVIFTFIVNAAFNFALGLLVAHFLGPDDFGRYALAQAVGVMLNTALIDWVRLSATRFSSARGESAASDTRPTLEAAFAVSSLGVALLCIGCAAAGVDLGLSVILAGLVPAVAIANGLFDYHAALTRARFSEGLFSRLVLVKNGLSLLLMAGGAWWLHQPAVVLLGMCVSLFAACLTVRRALGPEAATASPPSLARVKAFAAYALPIVIANSVYQLIPLYNRAAITSTLGFAETGRYSLAYDLGIKLFAAVGSALDIMLFQLAVRHDEQNGREAARRQVALNMGIVLAVVAPMSLGLLLVLPSLEALVVPPLFRGSFSSYLTALLPGFTAFAVMLYALNASFQISRRTYPIVVACVFAFTVDTLLVRRLPFYAMGVDYAHAQSIAMGAALLVTVAYVAIIMPVRPRGRDLGGVLLASGAMVAAVLPLHALEPSWQVLAASVGVGATVYAGAVWWVDACGLRRVRLFTTRRAEAA